MPERIIVIGLIIILAWISFLPQTALDLFQRPTFYGLFILLAISMINKRSFLKYLVEEDNIWMWLFFFALSLSVIFAKQSPDIARSRFIAMFIPSVILYLVCKNEVNKDNLLVIAISMCIFSSIVFFIGFLEKLFGKNIIYEYLILNPFYHSCLTRIYMFSTQMHYAVLGTYFMVCLPAFYFLIFRKGGWLKFLLFVGILFCFTGIMFSFSTGIYLSAIFLSLFFIYNKNRKFGNVLVTALIIFIIILSFVPSAKPRLIYSIKSVSVIPFHYRLSRLFATFRILEDHPYFGLGLEHFRLFFDKYYGIKGIPYRWKIPDNMYLMILGETGIIGFSLFFAFILSLFKRTIHYLVTLKDGEKKNLILIPLAGMIGLLTNMLTYDLLYWTMPLYFFWIFSGMLVGLTRVQQNV